ncbi:MAG: iron ABC transporter permease [Burkholderiales bacterium]|nr:iron ABC transporter permease [Burkholderiales bacterium]
MHRSSPLPVLAALALAALAALLFALAVGSVDVSLLKVWNALTGGAQDTAGTVVRELRLPRAVAAFAVGGLLAVAGALMQVLLRNPLADPYVLGLSGGAACGALVAMLLGAAALVTPFAFVGAGISTLLVFGLSRGRGAWTPTRILLTGIVVAAGWSALIMLMLSLAPEAQLRGMLFWLIGDLSGAEHGPLALVALVAVLVAAFALARDATLLSRGDVTAATVGVPVRTVTFALHALAAGATAIAVTVAGSVGFVGLVVPHAVRLVVGNDQRVLLPASALAGGALLVLADTLARTLVAPAQLPVGVLTALAGVPLFLWLLRRSAP